MLTLAVSEILTYIVFNLQNVWVGQLVKCFQSCPSMTNIKMYNSRPVHFVLALTVSEILTFQILYHQKVDQGHRVQFSQ